MGEQNGIGYDQKNVTSFWERNRPDTGQDRASDDSASLTLAEVLPAARSGSPTRGGLAVLPDRRTVGASRMCVCLVGASDEAPRDEEEGSG